MGTLTHPDAHNFVFFWNWEIWLMYTGTPKKGIKKPHKRGVGVLNYSLVYLIRGGIYGFSFVKTVNTIIQSNTGFVK